MPPPLQLPMPPQKMRRKSRRQAQETEEVEEASDVWAATGRGSYEILQRQQRAADQGRDPEPLDCRPQGREGHQRGTEDAPRG